MIRPLLLLLCVIAWPAAAQECFIPHVNPLNNDDACLCFRDGSILDTESCRARSTPAPSSREGLWTVSPSCSTAIVCPAGKHSVCDPLPVHCEDGALPALGPISCNPGEILRAIDSGFRCSPTLDEALAACKKHILISYGPVTTSEGVFYNGHDEYEPAFAAKCSRIRAMHDDAQSKRDLDTIDRFLDGQR